MRAMQKHVQEAVDEFVERMGLHSQADGLSRIAGRMLGFFILYDGPFSLAELAERLQVSRGSVSTNARLLDRLGMLERTGRAGDRQDYYRLAPRPYARLLEGYLERLRNARADVVALQSTLPAEWRQARGRLREMQRFYDIALQDTGRLFRALEEDDKEGFDE